MIELCTRQSVLNSSERKGFCNDATHSSVPSGMIGSHVLESKCLLGLQLERFLVELKCLLKLILWALKQAPDPLPPHWCGLRFAHVSSARGKSCFLGSTVLENKHAVLDGVDSIVNAIEHEKLGARLVQDTRLDKRETLLTVRFHLLDTR